MELILLREFNLILNYKHAGQASRILKTLLLWNYKLIIIKVWIKSIITIWLFMDSLQSIKMKRPFQINLHWTIKIYHSMTQFCINKFTLGLKLIILKINMAYIRMPKRKKMIYLHNMNFNLKMNNYSQKRNRMMKMKLRIFTEIWETSNYWL